MNWAGLERRLQPMLYPGWLESLAVRHQRRRLERTAPAATAASRRLFVDVSVISRNDAGTGIQRMVRAIASVLIAQPPPGWEVVPVGATRKRAYHPVSWPQRTPGAKPPPIQPRPGDAFLGLDFAIDDIHNHRRQLAAFRRCGGSVWFVMYDLLPMRRPDWFSDKLVVRYRKWFRTVAGLADGFFCISPPVEQELRQELAGRFGVDGGVQTLVVPMGSDFAAAPHGGGLPAGFDALLASLQPRPTALMVGTVEPRKGHADVLAAFERLWRQGAECNLVIVGRPGWKNEDLVAALRAHPQRGQRLHWLEDAGDAALAGLYEACTGVITASHAEGFGLPLIEALRHGKPVLARDLDVFRLHENHGVCYFPADAGAQVLAQAIAGWLEAAAVAPPAAPPSMPSWEDAARFLLASLEARPAAGTAVWNSMEI
jgi:glycosyltransferase involved in cell wall biosynthesis